MKSNWIRILLLAFGVVTTAPAEVLRYHTLVVDGQNKILPWFTPVSNAFDNYLDQCWAWALAAPLDAHGLPISYLYCAWNPGNPPSANPTWENDVGEKIPVWVESARLYYQYTGNRAPLDYVKGLVDYSLVHGQTPTNHVWPDFPVGTANAGDTEFRGFTNAPNMWVTWDCHVDLAADIGFSMYRMFQVYGDAKYRDKAIHVADVLATNIVTGNANDSPWPYVINSQNGANHSRYAASWDGALELFDLLIENNQGNVSNYLSARATLKNWLLTYPMQNGNWVDGHSDVNINGTNNWSTTCASDMCFYLLEHPAWDTNFLTDVPKLLKWTEDNFVNASSGDGLPGQYHGAYVPAEQTAYNMRMGYQAARLGAQYALWYEVSGDAIYKDRAYRCFAYNTYMMQTNGQSSDGPTDGVGFWWSDCYGEATRMYYYGMAAVPEWAPPDENHLLRSSSVVKAIAYTNANITYTIWDNAATELFRLASIPTNVLAGGVALPHLTTLTNQGWIFDGATGVLRVRHDTTNQIQVQLDTGNLPPSVSFATPISGASFGAPALVTLTANATGLSGTVTNVVFFVGTNRLAADATEPYTFIWPNVAIGSYNFTATVFDDNGRSNTSAPVTIAVTAPGGMATLGNTNEGTTTDYITDGSGAYINACRFQATANATVTQMRAKVGAIAGRYQCAIYADNGGNANVLLANTVTLTNVTTGWQTFLLTSSLALTNGNYYWLAIWSDDVNARVSADNSGTVRFAAYPFNNNWPNPINLTGSGGFTYCIYATGPAPTAFQQWKSNYGLAANTPNTSDANSNGIPLLLEYTYGLIPLTNSTAGSPAGKLQSNCLTLTYQKIKAATDITCVAEVSSNLTGPWLSGSNDVDQLWQVVDGLTTQTITARDKITLPDTTSRFMRLKVSQP